MQRIPTGTRLPALLLTIVVMTAGVAQGGEFTVDTPGEFKVLRSQLQAVQFLARATFGYSQNDIDTLAIRIRQIGHKRALAEWIDVQMGLTPTLHEGLGGVPPQGSVLDLLADDGYTTPYVDRPSGASNRNDYRDFAWWRAAMQAPDQLRQRVGFALMQILPINRDANIFGSNAVDSSGAPRYTGIVHYSDMLLQNAFGNYRTVLGDVAYHPVMGVFLTHKDNVKPSADGLLLPDENFAREILQLFSMGQFRTDINGVLVKDRVGNLIRNYTNEDIKALARVFTGMQYAVGDGTTSVNLHDPMEIRNFNNHDFNEKVFPTLRLTLPARSASVADANAEINEAIDYIFGHPNVAPYVSRILIQRLVKANPSTRYIREVSYVFNDNGQGVRGDMGAVVKAILLHTEALRSQRYRRIRDGSGTVGLRVLAKGTEHSKLVEPIVRYTQFIKMFDGQPIDPAKGIRLRPNKLDLSQLPYQAPSVFNYYRPDYQPPGFQNYTTSRRIPDGQLYSPESQIYTPVFANRFQNLMYRHMHNNYSSTNSYNSLTFYGSLTTEENLAASGLAATPINFTELLERLDLIMCHGSLSDASKTTINDALVVSGNTNASELARLAIFGVFGSPECANDE